MWELMTRGAMPYGEELANETTYNKIKGGELQLDKPSACPTEVFEGAKVQ